ncbi:unnamed protein product, partial [Amoebophrya sp. A25]
QAGAGTGSTATGAAAARRRTSGELDYTRNDKHQTTSLNLSAGPLDDDHLLHNHQVGSHLQGDESDDDDEVSDDIVLKKGLHRLAENRDLVLFAFAETQSPLTPFVTKYRRSLSTKHGLDIQEQTNARIEHQEKFGGGVWQSFTAKLATNINGNLKTLLLASSRLFYHKPQTFFGICPEEGLGPLVTNPKKAFSGKLLRLRKGRLKILCVGAHFPIASIARHLENPDKRAAMEGCKYVMA